MLPKQWKIPTIWKVLGIVADLDEFYPKRMYFLAHKPVMENFLNLKKIVIIFLSVKFYQFLFLWTHSCKTPVCSIYLGGSYLNWARKPNKSGYFYRVYHI